MFSLMHMASWAHLFIHSYSLSRYKGNHKSSAKFSHSFISGCDEKKAWNCPSEIQFRALHSWSGIISAMSVLNVLHNTSCWDFLTNRVFSESLVTAHLCDSEPLSVATELSLNPQVMFLRTHYLECGESPRFVFLQCDASQGFKLTCQSTFCLLRTWDEYGNVWARRSWKLAHQLVTKKSL